MKTNETSPDNLSRRKIWLFRILALLLGLIPLMLFELALILFGWQPQNAIEDPYVGFSNVRPLFVKSEDGSRMEVAAYREPLFCPDSFATEKPANGFRIFCVGGSTVQGRPFAIETAFSKWLQLMLETADPNHQFEVVNCGGVSYATYRLAPIVEELLNYQPNVVILYTGHNEFLEDRTYQSVKELPQVLNDTHGWLSKIRTYSFLRSLALAPPEAQTDRQTEAEDKFTLPEEVEARLDFAGGLALYHRDEAWKKSVIGHFDLNLRRMVVACREANIPIVLVEPVSNLRDAPPFKSEHRKDLSESARADFDRLMRSTERDTVSSQSQLEQDKLALEKALHLDPRHALAHFRLGQTYLQLGKIDEATTHLKLAREEDVCPLRILAPMETVVANVAAGYSVPLVKARQRFAANSVNGLVGAESLVDHVHPSIAGHQLLAKWILEELVANDLLPFSAQRLSGPFEEQTTAKFKAHLAQIPYLYFELGKDRLNGLRRWATGQVRKKKTPTPRTP